MKQYLFEKGSLNYNNNSIVEDQILVFVLSQLSVITLMKSVLINGYACQVFQLRPYSKEI